MSEMTFAQAEAANAARAYVQAHTHHRPKVGLVLGSGLSTLAARVEDPDVIPYADIPHMVRSTVEGHAGQLVIGSLSGTQVMIMQGRVHYYEGYSAAQITMPIRIMQAMDVSTLVVTNAAGGIRQGLVAGDLMAITDHINMLGIAGHNPLRGPNEDTLGPRFPSMARAYDPELLDLLRREAVAQNVPLKEGIYAMVAGPSFETPAEVRYLRAIGADAVGMSTAPEVVVARHAGMRVLGVSLISNVAISSAEGDYEEPEHAEVIEAGRRAVPVLASLIEGVLCHLA